MGCGAIEQIQTSDGEGRPRMFHPVAMDHTSTAALSATRGERENV